MPLKEKLRAVAVKTETDIAAMRRAGALAHDTLALALSMALPEAASGDIDRRVAQYIADHGATAGPLNYKGYPKSTCISLNNVICHGIPGRWRLSEGDIVCIDVTVILDGYYGDTAATVPVGAVSDEARQLMSTTLEACRLGIAAIRPGGRIGDVGSAIQGFVEPRGYSVVRNFVGHGIGTSFHEPPQVRHFGKAGTGPRLQPGMTFTVEPMINTGDWRSVLLDDGWTAVTADGGLSAQYEHTVAVTADGARILTLPAGHEGWLPPGGARV